MTLNLDKIVKDLEKRGFTETGSQTTSGTWDFEKEPVLEGIFIEKQENVGHNNSNIYVFEVKDHKRYGVWGSSVLDTRLKNLVAGEEVTIVFVGRAKSEKTGRTYKNYRVFHKSNEDTFNDDIPLPKESDR